jgi:L-ascorbate metabolism protein UlaG (beta-lactamase superfamily)
MEITWYGHSCFRFMERGIASIVADPYDKSIGLGEPKVPASDIVTISHEARGHNNVELVKKVMHVLDRPGEYEIGGVFITGLATYNTEVEPDETRKNVVFLYDFDRARIAHLGDLDHVPSQSQIEQFGPIDVLLVPVGGGGGLTSSQAAEVISLIEPGVVVPMHYHTKGHKLGLDPLDKFLKELGITEPQRESSLKVTSSTLSEETQVVVLDISE